VTPKEIGQKIKDLILNRKRAYQLVFDPKNQFTAKVIKDLAKFCRATETTFHADPRMHAALEGRREVFLRIQNHLNLTTEDLTRLYAGRDIE
jgi:hypothetical protein